MFKLFKAIKSTFKVLSTIVGALMAIHAVVTAVMVIIGVKKEQQRGGNTVEVQEGVSYKRYEASNVIGVDDNTLACATLNLNGEPMIITGGVFYDLTEPTQEAILAHEEGHIVLGHLETSNELSNLIRGIYPLASKVQPVELEADLYAAKKTSVAQTIAMLEELKTIPGINTRELDLRITALQQ